MFRNNVARSVFTIIIFCYCCGSGFQFFFSKQQIAKFYKKTHHNRGLGFISFFLKSKGSQGVKQTDGRTKKQTLYKTDLETYKYIQIYK